MNIKLKNADYSQTKISVVTDVVTLKKTSTTTSVLVIGPNFTNGQVLHYRITIDSVGSASGTSTFQFGVGSKSDTTNILDYVGTGTNMNVAVGNYIESNITIAKMNSDVDFKLTISNGTIALRTLKYTLQYYIVLEE